MIEADSDLLTAQDFRDEIQQQMVGAVISNSEAFLVLKRPADDFRGGTWELPSGSRRWHPSRGGLPGALCDPGERGGRPASPPRTQHGSRTPRYPRATSQEGFRLPVSGSCRPVQPTRSRLVATTRARDR